MEYDPQLALDLATVANQAYTDDMTGVLARFAGPVGRAIVRQRPGRQRELVAAFRGTRADELQDWLTDIDVERVPVTMGGVSCMVHAGFWHAVDQVRAELDRCLSQAPRAKLYITGHSLGGAMAALYAAGRRDVDALYTFGQPRAGDSAFAALLNSIYGDSYFRVVNDRDVVPRVPDEVLGYAHAGKLVMFDHAGKLSAPERMGPTSLDVPEDIADHLMTAYLPLLAKLQTLAPARDIGPAAVVAS